MHFGVPAAEIPAMENQSRRDAKSPNMPFVPDDMSKQAEAGERLHAVVAEHLQGVYVRLEAARRAQAWAREASLKTAALCEGRQL